MSTLRFVLLTATAMAWMPPAAAQIVTIPAGTLADPDASVTLDIGRITVLEGQVAANTTATATLVGRVADMTMINEAQQTAIGQIGAAVAAGADAAATLETRVGTVEQATIALDARVLAATDATVTLGGRVDAIETATNAVATRVTATEATVGALVPQVAQNTRAIADVDARATAGLDAVNARVSLNDARDDAQDATLNDHDRRIRVAQSTADTARVETATLRADVDTGRAGLVRQADPAGAVTVAAASGGTTVNFSGTAGDRRLTGIAAGVAANDAATVGQLSASASETLAAANGYTDRSIASAMASTETRFAQTLAGNNRLLRADIDSSAAGSAALASLPQSIIPGSGMFGASIGGKGEQVAMALGLSKAFDAPHVPILRAGAAIDTRTGDAVYNAAVGIHF